MRSRSCACLRRAETCNKERFYVNVPLPTDYDCWCDSECVQRGELFFTMNVQCVVELCGWEASSP